MIDLDEIERLAQAATPGPWEVKRRWSNGCEIAPRITCAPDADRGCGWIADMVGAPYLGHKTTLPNANFVAALNPAVVLELCRELRRLRELSEPGTGEGNG